MEFRLGFRLQEQLAITQLLSEQEALHGNFLIRRARTQFRGFVFNGKLDYFIQVGFDKGNVSLLNAEFRWKPDKYTQISFGQFFPPTYRQFQTVSKTLQMVDRSNVTRFFFTGYDLGIAARRTIPVAGNFYLKTAAALTQGEGANTAAAPGGWAYMGRLEVLPLGEFKSGGDYSESDLVGEESPKISIGTSYYKNRDAYTKYGNAVWDGLEDDITDISADVVFKYSGFSLIAEYIQRDVENEIYTPGSSPYISKMVSGKGVYLQGGKMLDEHLEPTFRFSYLDPDETHQIYLNSFDHQTKFALGLNYFFIGHSLKIQTQIGYVDEQFTLQNDRQYMEFLTQFTLSF